MVSQRNTRERGFTLIELVVVIVIIGILAAFAIPRFAGLAKDARVASVRGLLGTVRSSSALVHGLALARNQTAATGTVDLEGASVATVYGYPAGTDLGIKAAIGNIETYDVSSSGGTTTFTIQGATDAANCKVTFAQATAVLGPPLVVTPPIITAFDTGC